MRRIIAEDPHWTLDIVPSLSNLCLQTIVNTFKEKSIYEELTPTQKDFIQENLPPSLPLHLTANLIPDGVYWRRCCEDKWGLCDVFNYGHSWKRMFFERHLERMVELFIPDVTDPNTILQMVPLCKDYVKRLDISQLLPPIKEPKEESEAENAISLTADFEEDGPSIDHFDFGILLNKLTNLEELRLVCQVKQCGMNFEWKLFEMTDRDCDSLGKALKSCKTLKVFRLYQSHIGDKQCRMLVKYLLDHPSLRALDFSHNLIGDSGTIAIAKLLTRSKLEILNMYDNHIAGPGATAIADALTRSSTLLSLNLRLNRVRDEGGQAICNALMSNKTLLHLNLGANEVTWLTAVSLSKVLAQNKTLKSFNLSCNKLGEVGGKALEKAMSQNTSVTQYDIRLTEVNEQSFSIVNQAVWNNQSLERKKEEDGKKT
ncbi:dynein regulatory complex subunit 5 [Pholidichthys leucotaenia]